MKTVTYYVDNYSSGCARDIRGPFCSLANARKLVKGVKVSIDPYDGVVEQLGKDGGVVELVEARASSEESESEDYQAIYAVSRILRP